MIDTLKAVIEEADMRIHEIKRDAFEFRRDVVLLGNSPATFRPESASYTLNGGRTSKPGTATGQLRSTSAGKKGPKTDDSSESNNPAILNDKLIQDKLIKYLNDKETKIDTTIEKLKLKNVTLKNQIYKIEQQLEQKEENNDTLQYIDFHQLQIENKQNIIKISEKNDELIALKQSTNKTIQILNDLKSALNSKNDEVLWINAEIVTKDKIYEKLKHEQMRSRKSIDVQNLKLEKLLKNLNDMQMMTSADLTSTVIGEGDQSQYNLSLTQGENSDGVGLVYADDGDDDGSVNLESSSILSNDNNGGTDLGNKGLVSMQSSKSTVTATTTVSINDLPSTQDYIKQKKLMYEYQEGIRNLQRKLEILELAAKNLNIKTI